MRGEIGTSEDRLRGEIETVRGQIQTTEDRLRGEIQSAVGGAETRLRGEIQAVGDKVEILDKQVGHYEQRISYVEGNLDLGLGSPRQERKATETSLS